MDAPAPSLQPAPLPDLEPPEPALLPPEDLVVAASPRQPGKPHPLDSTGISVNGAGMVDLDGAPPPSLAPLPTVNFTSGKVSSCSSLLSVCHQKNSRAGKW